MNKIFCPRCGSSNLEEINEGYYKCRKCGYEGILGMEKGFVKKV
jgi:ribosomal protein L37AE/L43A